MSLHALYIRTGGKELFHKVVKEMETRVGREKAADLEEELMALVGDFPGPRRPQEPEAEYDKKLYNTMVDRDWHTRV